MYCRNTKRGVASLAVLRHTAYHQLHHVFGAEVLVGLALVGLALVGLALVGLAFVGLAFVGLAFVGLAFVWEVIWLG